MNLFSCCNWREVFSNLHSVSLDLLVDLGGGDFRGSVETNIDNTLNLSGVLIAGGVEEDLVVHTSNNLGFDTDDRGVVIAAAKSLLTLDGRHASINSGLDFRVGFRVSFFTLKGAVSSHKAELGVGAGFHLSRGDSDGVGPGLIIDDEVPDLGFVVSIDQSDVDSVVFTRDNLGVNGVDRFNRPFLA